VGLVPAAGVPVVRVPLTRVPLVRVPLVRVTVVRAPVGRGSVRRRAVGWRAGGRGGRFGGRAHAGRFECGTRRAGEEDGGCHRGGDGGASCEHGPSSPADPGAWDCRIRDRVATPRVVACGSPAGVPGAAAAQTRRPVASRGMADQLYFRQLLAGRDFAVGDPVATQMRNFAYLIGDRESREAVVVDPAYAVGDLLDVLAADDMRLTGVLVTHHHPDHVGGDFMGFSLPGLAELLGRQQVP